MLTVILLPLLVAAAFVAAFKHPLRDLRSTLVLITGTATLLAALLGVMLSFTVADFIPKVEVSETFDVAHIKQTDAHDGFVLLIRHADGSYTRDCLPYNSTLTVREDSRLNGTGRLIARFHKRDDRHWLTWFTLAPISILPPDFSYELIAPVGTATAEFATKE